MTSQPIVRRPLNVRCADCGHVFAPLFTPMEMLTAASILKSAKCPRCGAGSSRLYVNPSTPSEKEDHD